MIPMHPHLISQLITDRQADLMASARQQAISEDLSRPSYDLPASVASYGESAKKQATSSRSVYALAPSKRDVNILWAGTDDGLIHLTHDGGKTWSNVTPPGLTPWSKVSQLDASAFDDQTVYAAINRIRLDDQKPHIYRTHDGGATWRETVRGLPDGPVNVGEVIDIADGGAVMRLDVEYQAQQGLGGNDLQAAFILQDKRRLVVQLSCPASRLADIHQPMHRFLSSDRRGNPAQPHRA